MVLPGEFVAVFDAAAGELEIAFYQGPRNWGTIFFRPPAAKHHSIKFGCCMPQRKTIHHYKEIFLQKLGKLTVIIALIAFFISLSLNWFTVTTTNEHGVQEIRTIGSLGTAAAHRKANPDDIVKDARRPFPLIPTFLLLFGLALSTRKGRGQSDFEHLFTILHSGKKIRLTDLINSSGFDKQYVLDTLPDINLERGTSFYYRAEADLVVDEDSTIDWHLNSQCENCGANANTEVNILIGKESLVCPYCSNSIHDPEFEKLVEASTTQTKPKRWFFLPS